MFTVKRVLFFGIFLPALFFACGCYNSDNLLPSNQAGEIYQTLSGPSAQLNISIKHSHELAAALRGANTAQAIFELKLVNYGNSASPFTLLRKRADISANSATVTFDSVPVVSTIVSMQLEGASLDGKREFHAGIDLMPGMNNLALVASGSAVEEDVIAMAAFASVNDYSTMLNLPASLFFSLKESWQGLATVDQTSSAKLFAAMQSKISGFSITALAAGESHSMALRSDGTFAAFGSNTDGQLGKSGTTTQLERRYVPFHQPVAQLAAGADFSLLLGRNKKVYACGNNEFGQLGNSTLSLSAYPIEISGLENIAAISAGFGNAMVIDSAGNLLVWGRNNRGQLGLAIDTLSQATPKLLAAGVKQAAAGSGFILILKTDGSVFAVGDNQFAQLAADVGDYSITPVQIGALSNIIQIAAGESHCLALNSSGNVFAWGSNLNGQCGLGATLAIETPTILGGLNGITEIRAGKNFSLFKNAASTLWGTGSSDSAQLAGGSSTTSPSQMASPTGVGLLAAGGSHGLAFTTTLLAWGSNNAGQCGNGQTSDAVTTPAERALGW
ncbi:MAG: RCC1 domain-containing protein [Candidatus Rifleibacteriota bacterium]